jgi:hypothetical protein
MISCGNNEGRYIGKVIKYQACPSILSQKFELSKIEMGLPDPKQRTTVKKYFL